MWYRLYRFVLIKYPTHELLSISSLEHTFTFVTDKTVKRLNYHRSPCCNRLLGLIVAAVHQRNRRRRVHHMFLSLWSSFFFFNLSDIFYLICPWSVKMWKLSVNRILVLTHSSDESHSSLHVSSSLFALWHKTSVSLWAFIDLCRSRSRCGASREQLRITTMTTTAKTKNSNLTW